jgi:hypothetical protein
MKLRNIKKTLSTKRRGSLTMEMILLFPIALAFFLAMIEFSLILHCRQQILAASREGCRVAALGGDVEEVQVTIKRYLGDGRLGEAEVELTNGDGESISSSTIIHSGDPVEVWVRIPTGYVVPDLLRCVGYSIRNDEIVARTVMRKE